MAEYKHDHSGLRAIAVAAEMHVALIDIVLDEAIPFAKSISPDAPPYGEGYIAKFEADGGHYETIAGLRRATVYLRNTADYAWFVEKGIDGSGSSNTGHHVLARTAAWLERT